MQGFLDCCDGQPILHRSKWRCLTSSYSAEIRALFQLVERVSSNVLHQESFCHKLAGPLKALELALQEGLACMQNYIILRPGDYHSWLVDKALKLSMSTDVVNVHLHHFLCASSTVRDQIFRIAKIEGIEADLLQQLRELREIWAKVDADDDLQTARSFLIKLKDKYKHVKAETCELIDFILHKLSHIEAPHDHVAPDSLTPNYMCIASDECLQKKECLIKNDFTEIHRVEWLGGRFVLKSFQRMDQSNPTEIQQFKREAAIQARICHSHVVPLVCCTNNPPGLLLESMQENLHALITRRKGYSVNNQPFSLLIAVDLMLQIAKGMEYLHSDILRIIHRDLKSHNILVSFPMESNSNHTSSVSPQVHLKIADFGVSKAKHDCSEYTTRDQGTTCWMAPEVYDGGNDLPKYSNKADVYSFGMVCFEILTGHIPFEGRAVRGRVLEGTRPTLPPHCPPALSSFIQMCWHADPTERPTFIQICRMLRYFKACLLLKKCHYEVDYWLSVPLVAPDICAHIDNRIEHSLGGLILEPKALSIPLEMYWCGVELHKFGFLSRDSLYSAQYTEGWDNWNATMYKVSADRLPKLTREQQMCKAGVLSRWFRKKVNEEAPDLWPRSKRLRCFTFEELRCVTWDFSSLMIREEELGKSREKLAEGQENVYHGRLPEKQEVAVISFTQKKLIRSELLMNSGPLLGWCREQGTLFLVFPCPAKIQSGHPHVASTSKKVYSQEATEAKQAYAQQMWNDLHPPETNKRSSFHELSERAEQARIRAEIERLRELNTLKGHVESVMRRNGLDTSSLQQSYSV